MALRSTPRSLLPARWLGETAWTSRLGSWLSSGLLPAGIDVAPRRRGAARRAESVATARLEFAEALFDIRTMAAADLLDRIAVCRSLADLWHLREAVFSHIARRHDQGEASRRVAELDRHFARRGGAMATPPRHPLHDPL